MNPAPRSEPISPSPPSRAVGRRRSGLAASELPASRSRESADGTARRLATGSTGDTTRCIVGPYPAHAPRPFSQRGRWRSPRIARARRSGSVGSIATWRHQQLVPLGDDASHIIRQAAVGERRFTAPLEQHDLGLLAQAANPCCRRARRRHRRQSRSSCPILLGRRSDRVISPRHPG